MLFMEILRAGVDFFLPLTVDSRQCTHLHILSMTLANCGSFAKHLVCKNATRETFARIAMAAAFCT